MGRVIIITEGWGWGWEGEGDWAGEVLWVIPLILTIGSRHSMRYHLTSNLSSDTPSDTLLTFSQHPVTRLLIYV